MGRLRKSRTKKRNHSKKKKVVQRNQSRQKKNKPTNRDFYKHLDRGSNPFGLENHCVKTNLRKPSKQCMKRYPELKGVICKSCRLNLYKTGKLKFIIYLLKMII